MKEVMRKRFIADCGRGFWVRSKCAKHEQNCTCWTNARNKTCKTCIHSNPETDRDDSGRKNTYWNCAHDAFQDHINLLNLDYISIGCPLWSAAAIGKEIP